MSTPCSRCGALRTDTEKDPVGFVDWLQGQLWVDLHGSGGGTAYVVVLALEGSGSDYLQYLCEYFNRFTARIGIERGFYDTQASPSCKPSK